MLQHVRLWKNQTLCTIGNNCSADNSDNNRLVVVVLIVTIITTIRVPGAEGVLGI